MTDTTRETDGVSNSALEAIAAVAAEKAAERVAGGIRAEVQQGMAQMESNIAGHIEILFARHFGSMDPQKHIEQHTRLDLFLRRIDDMQSGFWKGIAGTVGKYVVILLVVGAVAYFKLKG